ncbi:putative ABC transport system ATP-binding protein [Sporobacter termitidis DSM 10068]|uniref:Putative ABC transport system ATP-binding protein n=1 Tax=Sporobacter termitidis DSM 10068 TaxID=1123282 RepID=A0A1M5Z0R1_9FIRM|nr:ABC transporter ATP-binding protein [Sporobacter termitidis]SHI17877.1 putative ABC transport system ATP-binding protein [Sporobacter termitidis DSM 10068]
MAFIEFRDVVKEYGAGEHAIRAADRVSFEIEKGEFAVILGPSGAGKSTVLNLLGGMDRATGGAIRVDGTDISRFNDDALTSYRCDTIGFVFQFYNLIPTLTACENVALVKDIVKNAADAGEALEAVGLGDHLRQFPAQLSGGEQQRMSIARAVSKKPKLLLCDEPTGALDSETGMMILALLQRMCRENGQTVVVVTHNTVLTQIADRVIRLKNGRIVEQSVNPAPMRAEEVSW